MLVPIHVPLFLSTNFYLSVYSIKNFTICTNSDIDGNVTKSGVLTSDRYPNFVPNQNCRRKIVAPSGKFVRVFVTDLSIEEPEFSGE